MEQIRKRDASPSSESSTITREKFIQEKTVDKNDRYALAFFGDGDGWYCYCDQMVKEKAVLKASLVGNLAIAKFAKYLTYLTILSNLLINSFNMSVLCNFYDQLSKDLVMLFDQCPKATECFLGENMCTVVAIGTLANIGAFPFQKVFGTMTA